MGVYRGDGKRDREAVIVAASGAAPVVHLQAGDPSGAPSSRPPCFPVSAFIEPLANREVAKLHRAPHHRHRGNYVASQGTPDRNPRPGFFVARRQPARGDGRIEASSFSTSATPHRRSSTSPRGRGSPGGHEGRRPTSSSRCSAVRSMSRATASRAQVHRFEFGRYMSSVPRGSRAPARSPTGPARDDDTGASGKPSRLARNVGFQRSEALQRACPEVLRLALSLRLPRRRRGSADPVAGHITVICLDRLVCFSHPCLQCSPVSTAAYSRDDGQCWPLDRVGGCCRGPSLLIIWIIIGYVPMVAALSPSSSSGRSARCRRLVAGHNRDATVPPRGCRIPRCYGRALMVGVSRDAWGSLTFLGGLRYHILLTGPHARPAPTLITRRGCAIYPKAPTVSRGWTFS